MQYKLSSASVTIIVIATLSIALSLPRPSVALDDSKIIAGAKRIGHVSAGALETKCNNSGGTYLETPDEYMCSTDSSWVYCEKKSGECVGETDNKSGKRKNTRMVNRQKRKVQARVSGKSSQRGKRRSQPMGTAPLMR